MSRRWILGLVAAVLVGAAPAAGQSTSTIEFGAFGRYTSFDSTLAFEDGFGGGGWLGVFLFPRLSVEGEASLTPTEGVGGASVSYIPLRARLVYSQPLPGPVTLLIGGGYVHNEYREDIEGADNGVTGLAGLRVRFSRSLTLRVEGTGDYIGSPANLESDNWNFGAQAGLSLLLGPLFGGGEPDTYVAREPLDSDRDGVTDQFDACPDTPRGEVVDGRGCPLVTDGDGDGVADADDACPDTPAGADVDARGCRVSVDSDGDGVVDHSDVCPDTPAGIEVDDRGCPLPGDSDRDGVSDLDDSCPGTPAGERVDARGCPLLIEEAAGPLILEGVRFESGSSELTPQARRTLDRVAESLRAHPDAVIEVAGYTDDAGSRPFNFSISLARAVAVRLYLIERGVSGRRLLAKGYSSADPIADNDTPEGRAMNRRVELRRLN
ncbi:MAG: OmpA family protein [Gemmatimonadota bacterium]|nr:MAG: OmpA family protein [Gemmatimonadota bacterium]